MIQISEFKKLKKLILNTKIKPHQWNLLVSIAKTYDYEENDGTSNLNEFLRENDYIIQEIAHERIPELSDFGHEKRKEYKMELRKLFRMMIQHSNVLKEMKINKKISRVHNPALTLSP